MEIKQTKVRKLLSKKIQQLNDIVADLDQIVTSIDLEFYRVCIFGSARIRDGEPEYQRAFDLAKVLAAEGVDIVTGGGPGLMEAANRGAQEGSNKSRSIGVPIELPFEASANAHLDVKFHHKRFSSRLDEFMRISHAIVTTPGGIGTVLELMYTWQLLQVGHMERKPVILIGSKFWEGFINWMQDMPLRNNLMNASDFDAITVVDTPEEVAEVLRPEIAAFRAKVEEKKKINKNKDI